MNRNDSRREALMREVRKLLAFAHEREVSGEIEYADAAGAVAGNKLAIVDRINRNEEKLLEFPLGGKHAAA